EGWRVSLAGSVSRSSLLTARYCEAGLLPVTLPRTVTDTTGDVPDIDEREVRARRTVRRTVRSVTDVAASAWRGESVPFVTAVLPARWGVFASPPTGKVPPVAPLAPLLELSEVADARENARPNVDRMLWHEA